MAGKPPGARVKLRVAFGPIPPVDTVLRLASGRRYQVLAVKGKGLDCIVLAPGDAPGAPVWDWQWSPRKRKPKHTLQSLLNRRP